MTRFSLPARITRVTFAFHRWNSHRGYPSRRNFLLKWVPSIKLAQVVANRVEPSRVRNSIGGCPTFILLHDGKHFRHYRPSSRTRRSRLEEMTDGTINFAKNQSVATMSSLKKRIVTDEKIVSGMSRLSAQIGRT